MSPGRFARVAALAVGAAATSPAAAQDLRTEFMCDCICMLADTAYCPFTPQSSSTPKEYSAWLGKNGQIAGKTVEFYSECRQPQACDPVYYSHPAVHPLSSNWIKTYGAIAMKGWVRVEQASGGFYPDFKPQPIWSWSGPVSMTAWPTLVPVKP